MKKRLHFIFSNFKAKVHHFCQKMLKKCVYTEGVSKRYFFKVNNQFLKFSNNDERFKG